MELSVPVGRGSVEVWDKQKGKPELLDSGNMVPTSVLSKMGHHDNYWAGEMLHVGEGPATKPDELSPIPGPMWWKERTNLFKLVFGFHTCRHTHLYTHTVLL